MKKPIYKRKWFIALVIVFLFCALAGGCGSDDTSSDQPKDNDKVAEEQKEEKEEPKENVSQEFKNALNKAQIYSDTMYMSKQGIYDQLVSENGENFPEDAAQYAIDNLDADYNYNALKKAETYYEEMSMSKDAVYDQLTSEYGEKFTSEQAQYAVDHLK